ncbi:MAG: AAA family ATPase [Candidatus Pacebacteria bacterium]|nr:AAA family ATPase [Candidatus Paceibacterota bacterium]
MPNIRSYNYHNIAISGLPGSGSTTLLRLLKEHLDLDGWRGYSGGEFMRAYAAEKGLFDNNKKLHHKATHYEDEFDRQIDMGVREKLKTEKKWIIESWLAGFLAQEVPKTLKVLLICTDDAVRIDRIVNRDEVNVDEAKHHIKERYQDNLAKWSRMYEKEWKEWVVKPETLSIHNPIDFWNPKLYDVVIDTYSTNQSKTLDIVLDAITKKKKAN